MKKLVALLTIVLLTSFNSIQSDVYICVSKGAKKYHLSKSCRGLSNCKHQIKAVTKKEAQNLGLSLCAWED
ncbi:hypothetical protein ACFSX9_06400 [Flavobacterium ardleyense]|uniref:Uncharacterized protein n=1 Tax=Flavobacterium ardleyense TaxID=2038737 RepID=A0ABW5Z6I4_9FLAO